MFIIQFQRFFCKLTVKNKLCSLVKLETPANCSPSPYIAYEKHQQTIKRLPSCDGPGGLSHIMVHNKIKINGLSICVSPDVLSHITVHNVSNINQSPSCVRPDGLSHIMAHNVINIK